MESNELRIGNLIHHNDGTAMPIEYFTESSITLTTPKGGNWHFRYDEVEPIPLTKEHLLFFGFIPTYHESGKSFSSWEKDGHSWLKEDFTLLWFGTKVEYVHQLQNLYFALKGKELPVS